MSPAAKGSDALRRLAHAHGIQLSYTAHDGRRIWASADALLATLDALGVAATTEASIADSSRQLDSERLATPLQPVIVVGSTGMLSSPVVVPGGSDLSRCWLTVVREDGDVVRRRLSEVVAGQPAASSDNSALLLAIDLGALDLPPGYHELSLESTGMAAAALLLVPPPTVPLTARGFGVFAPVYALRGSTDWGVGTFTELARLADYAGALGAEILGTLPMFPTFFEPPVDPSPYLPVSRLFINELFIDVELLPEFTRSDAARSMVGTAGFARDCETSRQLPKVDYDAVMSRKRGVLELCAAELFDQPSPRRDSFETFLAGHPELSSYADFRAAADSSARRYHLYSQFAAAEQLAIAAGPGDGTRAGLYLDLPVGVHPDGFDTWSHAEVFAPATVGAPPDRLAPQGQAWGFPPLHPQRLRHDRYRYVINCYRHLLAHARMIRIDHVLGLERLFWIAKGADASEGAYVRYRREELLAIVALEAERAGAVVVGEDLGTVPAGIRQAMDRTGMLHSFVYQFAASAADPLPQPTSPSLASLGSHDLPRFAAFWRGEDIDDRVARGVTTEAAAAAEHVKRDRLVAAVDGGFATCIGALAAGPAPYVMVDLADIEGETQPDNRPGTGPEADNWRQRLARPLSEITSDDRVADTLTTIAAQRQHGEPQGVKA